MNQSDQDRSSPHKVNTLLLAQGWGGYFELGEGEFSHEDQKRQLEDLQIFVQL